MNKPSKRTYPRPLAELLDRCLGDAFARQGFASKDIVTHWADIVGADLAAYAEPIKLQWPRSDAESAEPATLILRVEGPAALEVQHMSAVILERVNRFFGWRAVGPHRAAPGAARATCEICRDAGSRSGSGGADRRRPAGHRRRRLAPGARPPRRSGQADVICRNLGFDRPQAH